MPEEVVTWLLKDDSGNKLCMPVTDLNRIMKNVTSMEDITDTNRIAQGGVIKREYLAHDIMVIIGIFDNDHIPDYELYAKGERYFNSTTHRLYLRWTNGWEQPKEPDIDRMFVSNYDGKLYRYFNNTMTEVYTGEVKGLSFEED